ncbi:MAG: thiamine pyrophosphate-dependent enzyme, partial [Alphaproteobacteria bacterium]|nr:thiamine pyrophosphate-dependent enzyme [Alphaproteobacteria bacterium]
MSNTIADDGDPDIALYRRMRLLRRFDEMAADLAREGEIVSAVHDYTGQEAVAVGVCSALGPDDVITSTHRGHGHILAKGGDPA